MTRYYQFSGSVTNIRVACVTSIILSDAMIIYRMVIVEGRCDKLQLLISIIYDHWYTQKYIPIVSSDWSDTMLDIAVTFFYHPIYMIIDQMTDDLL